MFRPLARSHRRPPRRGTVVLITCFFLITIMMVLGLALMMYAAREKAAALAYQEAGGGAAAATRVAPPPESAVNHFLGSLIYDATDDGDGLTNSLRGHSIARSMYGSRYDFSAATWGGETTPWAGVGTFHESAATYTYNGTNPFPSLAGVDRAKIVNHTALRMDNQFLLVDPEWTGNRWQRDPSNNLLGFAATRTGNYIGKHAGYTYPDLKSFFLAARDPATGAVLVPSFHRDWLFQDPDPTHLANKYPLAPDNVNWTNDAGRALTLRPRPGSTAAPEHPKFPRVPPNADGSYTGDVQNLPGGYTYDPVTKRFVGRNDSLWMHVGLPTITLSDGRVVQPMVAPLVLPLDGNFDLSAHGNSLRAGGAHHSYGGYGRWEVNPTFGLTADPTQQGVERQKLVGDQPNGPRAAGGRSAAFDNYNPGQIVTNPGPTTTYAGQLLPAYAPVAWTGAQVEFKLPSEAAAPNTRRLLGLPSSGDQSYQTPGTPPMAAPFGNFQSDNLAAPSHPAAYNANEFAPATETSEGNPATWSPVFPYSDLKRLSLRYAFTPSWYLAAFAPRRAGATFMNDPQPPAGYTPGQYEYLHAPGAGGAPAPGNFSYRLDPAHARRNLFSPRYGHLERPALAPNFVRVDQTTALQIPTGSAKPATLTAASTPYPYATAPATPRAVSDFLADNRWVNVRAALGSVNLNRPLADYRLDPTKALYPDSTKSPIDPTNKNVDAASPQFANAEKDRQALAKDIFARLIVATGAAGDVGFGTDPADPPGTPDHLLIRLPNPAAGFLLTPFSGTPVTYTQQHYDALRYLAQLAANLVDYIDNDDISTAFLWNPSGGGLAADLAATEVGNRVVFGVEKPRLVINEVYAEITNDPADKDQDTPTPMMLPPDKKAHVRFWAELLNPTATPHQAPPGLSTTPQGVLGDGSVPLAAYQIQIARASRTFKATSTLGSPETPALPLVPLNPNDPLDPKQVANTTGAFDASAGGPDATFSFTGAGVTLPFQSVAPSNGEYVHSPSTQSANGIVLLRTDIDPAKVKTDEFNPDGATGVWQKAIVCPQVGGPSTSNALGYSIQIPKKEELSKSEFKRHVVLLRRLANPYLAEGPTNPFVTVDMMDYVPAFDAVLRASGDALKRTARNNEPDTDKDKYDPVSHTTPASNRFSVGRVQPLAGYACAALSSTAGPGGYNKYSFDAATAPTKNSMVLSQTVNPPAPGTPVNTFGRHNGKGATEPTGGTVLANAGQPAKLNPAVDDQIMLPFDWLVHMDRPLETPGDVLFARDCKPFQLTQEFVTNNPTTVTAPLSPGLYYDQGYARWRQHNEGVGRALELLAVKSPDAFTAHGGRSAGKVNLNAVNDRRVAQGVWDAPAAVTTGNRFDQSFVDGTVWGPPPAGPPATPPASLFATRSPLQNVVGASGSAQYQVPVPNRRWDTATSAFVPACSAQDLPTLPSAYAGDRPFLPFGAPVASSSATAYAYNNPTGNGDGDTLLRRPGPNGLPYLYQPTEAHAYTQSEPFRKVVNNVTTVSHTFVVYLTIGYFDVEAGPTPPNWPANVPVPPQFGAEVYDQVPGDLRQKYIAVVDMSNLALKPDAANIGADAHADQRPVFTSLTATARAPIPPIPNPPPAVVLSVAHTVPDPVNKPNEWFVMADGARWLPAVGSKLVIGYGNETQVVTVDAVGPRAPNVSDPDYPGGLANGQIGVRGLLRDAWGGTVVSNVRPGYAGPRTGFDLFTPPGSAKNLMYNPVVPYIERLK